MRIQRFKVARLGEFALIGVTSHPALDRINHSYSRWVEMIHEPTMLDDECRDHNVGLFCIVLFLHYNEMQFNNNNKWDRIPELRLHTS